MKRLKLSLKLAALASSATFALVLASALGFLLRLTDWTPAFSAAAGYLFYGAVAAAALCFVCMYAASRIAHVVQFERDAQVEATRKANMQARRRPKKKPSR